METIEKTKKEWKKPVLTVLPGAATNENILVLSGSPRRSSPDDLGAPSYSD